MTHRQCCCGGTVECFPCVRPPGAFTPGAFDAGLLYLVRSFALCYSSSSTVRLQYTWDGDVGTDDLAPLRQWLAAGDYTLPWIPPGTAGDLTNFVAYAPSSFKYHWGSRCLATMNIVTGGVTSRYRLFAVAARECTYDRWRVWLGVEQFISSAEEGWDLLDPCTYPMQPAAATAYTLNDIYGRFPNSWTGDPPPADNQTLEFDGSFLGPHTTPNVPLEGLLFGFWNVATQTTQLTVQNNQCCHNGIIDITEGAEENTFAWTGECQAGVPTDIAAIDESGEEWYQHSCDAEAMRWCLVSCCDNRVQRFTSSSLHDFASEFASYDDGCWHVRQLVTPEGAVVEAFTTEDLTAIASCDDENCVTCCFDCQGCCQAEEAYFAAASTVAASYTTPVPDPEDPDPPPPPEYDAWYHAAATTFNQIDWPTVELAQDENDCAVFTWDSRSQGIVFTDVNGQEFTWVIAVTRQAANLAVVSLAFKNSFGWLPPFEFTGTVENIVANCCTVSADVTSFENGWVDGFVFNGALTFTIQDNNCCRTGPAVPLHDNCLRGTVDCATGDCDEGI